MVFLCFSLWFTYNVRLGRWPFRVQGTHYGGSCSATWDGRFGVGAESVRGRVSCVPRPETAVCVVPASSLRGLEPRLS